MLRKIVQNKTAFLGIFISFIALVLIRGFENELFYDPFIGYFKNDYLNVALPEFENLKLLISMTFRFLLNTVFSLLIIYFLFNDNTLTKFAAILYALLFVVLLLFFFVLLHFFNESNNFILFYVRRFLIQPLFLVVFVPAFYYQKSIK